MGALTILDSSRSHESSHQEHCTETSIPIDGHRLYNPTWSDAGRWCGLSSVQRMTLTRADEAGYNSTPRQGSADELAAEFGVTDQAVSERLRRGVQDLVSSTVLVTEQAE